MVCAWLFKEGIETKRIVRHIWPCNIRDWPALFWPKIARSLKGCEVVKCAYQVRHPRKHSLSALKCSFEASAFPHRIILPAPLLPHWGKTDQWSLHFPRVLYKSKRNCELQYAIPLRMLLSCNMLSRCVCCCHSLCAWCCASCFFYLIACNKHLFHGQARSV